MNKIPRAIRDDMARARKLEWSTLIGMSTIVVVMYFTMGASQAMKTAFLEDLLSLVPAITFLVAANLERREPTEKYPYGFVRSNSLAFLASAVVLMFVGLWLLYDGASALIMLEHPTIGPVEFFGRTVWLGWLMIAALAYSIVIPVVLGRMKLPVARRLRDKVLHTDADMQKADWQTGVAGIVGILGIGMGLWWADSAAAMFISLSIIRDGFRNVRTASAELLDGAPRELASASISEEAKRLRARLLERWPQASIRMRESGRYLIADIGEIEPPIDRPSLDELMGEDASWRLAKVSFTPPGYVRPQEGE